MMKLSWEAKPVRQRCVLAAAFVLIPLAIASCAVRGFPPRLSGVGLLNEVAGTNLSSRIVHRYELIGWQDNTLLFAFDASPAEIRRMAEAGGMKEAGNQEMVWPPFERPYWWKVDAASPAKLFHRGSYKSGMIVHYDAQSQRTHLCKWEVRD